MKKVIRFIFWVVGSLVLSLRYRIRVHGREKLRGHNRKLLILPNHPGYIDPPLVMCSLGPWLRPHPMVYAGTFTNPVLSLMAGILDAVRVPDLERPDAEARQKAEQAIRTLIDGVNSGVNHIMWPSGRLQREGFERIGGAEALVRILREVPDATIVLVRTRGVWGSSFTFAQSGKLPDFGDAIKRGIWTVLSNFFFFTPRRNVDITIEVLDRSQLPSLELHKINKFFEDWYNQDVCPEKPTYVPYHFLFGPRTFDFPSYEGLQKIDESLIKPETKAGVAEILSHKLERKLSEAELQANVTLDEIGLSSLKRGEVQLEIEEKFQKRGEQAPLTIGQAWALAQGISYKSPPPPPPPEWTNTPSATGPVSILGDTLPEAFVRRALACRKEVAVSDDIAGAKTFEQLLTGALLMAKRIKTLPGDNVAMMLPASVACDIVLMGIQLAGKLPVLLNWTTGYKNVEHAVQTMKVSHIISSEQFVNRERAKPDYQAPSAQFLFVEELFAGFSKLDGLWTLLGVRYFSRGVLSSLPKQSPVQPAVVLFTSGSEKAPKAVPLTHTNILSNLKSGIQFLEVTRQDCVIGFLPAFHSFGMSVTGFLPLVAGLRVAHHPDPTDSSTLAHKIGAYSATLLVATPTFVNYIFDRASPEQLKSLRVIMCGAEACPPALFERVKTMAPQAHLLEGYGVTECSPIISANRPAEIRSRSIGKPIPGVEVRVLEVDDAHPLGVDPARALPAEKMGMLVVNGLSVFPGYIGFEGAQPFVEHEGKRWYVTGDLVHIDTEGYIFFRGRLKRFLKIAGEMVSLPALEAPLVAKYPAQDKKHRVAVEGTDKDGKSKLVLFTTEAISLPEANALLQQAGLRGVMRLDEVRRVEEIPEVGPSKINYKALKAMVEVV